jgi:hypothetical protein
MEYGDCVMTQILNEQTGEYDLRIDKADKHILITVELVNGVAKNPTRTAWLDGEDLHIGNIGGEVVYRLGGAVREYDTDCYEAERIS